MTGTCAIIVCDHGLGHVRRCALMAKAREKLGDRVTLFVPHMHFERLQRAIPSVAGLSICDFATHTTPCRIRQGLSQAVEWLQHLPSLDRFENVISDNLPEILDLRSDSIISAQFFWHDAIEGAAKDYVYFCEQLLSQHKPRIIGCDKFTMESVRRQPGFESVGLYKNPDLLAAAEATTRETPTDLLITGGTTKAVRNQLQQLIHQLLKTGPQSYTRVHVDPELMPDHAPTWMIKADFSVDMYCKLQAAICRPGLGVITDLITVGASIYPVYEPNNREMKHNASVLDSWL